MAAGACWAVASRCEPSSYRWLAAPPTIPLNAASLPLRPFEAVKPRPLVEPEAGCVGGGRCIPFEEDGVNSASALCFCTSAAGRAGRAGVRADEGEPDRASPSEASELDDASPPGEPADGDATTSLSFLDRAFGDSGRCPLRLGDDAKDGEAWSQRGL